MPLGHDCCRRLRLAQVNLARLKALLDSPQLKDFVDALKGRHREMPARRRGAPTPSGQWGRFERVQEAMVAMWWVPAGHRLTVAEAESRLLHLRTHGPAPYAFTLRTSYPPPEGLGCSV
ncbi:DUF3291 domain-containing protein [Streptomyces sp. CA-179760]|uniref:DUF3291 domain-containing protein n=1 Tax=Streptomyces sp. CA-179760 TaxID=3240054 RepID=UPI003D8B8EAF